MVLDKRIEGTKYLESKQSDFLYVGEDEVSPVSVS